MEKSVREIWEARRAGFAAFEEWEASLPPPSPEEHALAVRVALEGVDLWLRHLPEDRREPEVDLAKVEGIGRMRAALRVLR